MKEKSLHSGINLKKLKIAYGNFKKIPFPKQPEDDALYDLYSDLVEFDAYIAGLIFSLINGKKINKKDLYIDEKIKNCLKDIDTNKRGDKIFMSKDGIRKVRFDIKYSHGDKPHIHFEKNINGEWIDATNKHRIYPKD